MDRTTALWTRAADVVPLLLAGVVTLEICVAIGLQLNFANIIALPVLLGVGVAFKIYYIIVWRAGQTGLLQSSLTRAVLFSAMTTATAFGNLMRIESSRYVQHGGKADGPRRLPVPCSPQCCFKPLLMVDHVTPERRRISRRSRGRDVVKVAGKVQDSRKRCGTLEYRDARATSEWGHYLPSHRGLKSSNVRCCSESEQNGTSRRMQRWAISRHRP